MLVVSITELPQLPKGKGVKIIGIPSHKLGSREEYVAAVICVQDGESLTVRAGQRHKILKGAEVDGYVGERGRRGLKLPRGFRKVDALVIDE